MSPVDTAPEVRVLRLAGTPASVGELRGWAGKELAACGCGGEVVERVRLVASELANNAVTHSESAGPEGCYIATLRRHPNWVDIEVTDDGGPTIPEPRPIDPADLDACGRGLALVEALAERWWTYPCAGARTTGARIMATSGDQP